MTYQIMYNPVRKIWTVWRVYGQDAEIVKVFKTEASAQRWVSKQGT